MQFDNREDLIDFAQGRMRGYPQIELEVEPGPTGPKGGPSELNTYRAIIRDNENGQLWAVVFRKPEGRGGVVGRWDDVTYIAQPYKVIKVLRRFTSYERE